eukprot:792965-Rhodomonas_salina.1
MHWRARVKGESVPVWRLQAATLSKSFKNSLEALKGMDLNEEFLVGMRKSFVECGLVPTEGSVLGSDKEFAKIAFVLWSGCDSGTPLSARAAGMLSCMLGKQEATKVALGDVLDDG